MSRTGAARRNRALRKIRASHGLPPEIKLTAQALLDLLSAQSDYQLAWPSAARLARQTGKGRRTILWHIKAIKQLNIFHMHRFTPREAVDYVYGKYGFVIKLDGCRHQAPNLFEVNTDHPLWDTSRTIPRENRTLVGSDRPARQFQPQWPPISMKRSCLKESATLSSYSAIGVSVLSQNRGVFGEKINVAQKMTTGWHSPRVR